jgi:pimeloyl-ACP methyl ester carboxylesterase
MNPDATYIPHAYPEQTFDTGEVLLNYAVAGDEHLPALLLIPGQSESWWGYEKAMPLLAEHFRVYAVDLRGQGRSTWTPGRYTLDNFGNDLVRFIADGIRRPVICSGLSSGGVISAWLSAYALPGQIRGAHYEDPPLFSSELMPAVGPSLKQSIGEVFALRSKYLGDQWSVGDWEGMVAAAPHELPDHLRQLFKMSGGSAEPPQNMKEYDPEWARAFWTGTVAASCDHSRMLSSVKVPVLFTHHFRTVDAQGRLLGAISDVQAEHARALIEQTGSPLTYQSFPRMGHSMHGQDPGLFTKTLVDWAATLGRNERAGDTEADGAP